MRKSYYIKPDKSRIYNQGIDDFAIRYNPIKTTVISPMVFLFRDWQCFAEGHLQSMLINIFKKIFLVK